MKVVYFNLLFLLLACPFSPSSLSAEEAKQDYQIAEKKEVFVAIKNPLKGPKEIWLSQNCQKNKCNVIKALSKINPAAFLNNNNDTFTNPGSHICLQIGGRVLRGKDHLKNEISFCGFGDNSLVSLGTLHMLSLNQLSKSKEE